MQCHLIVGANLAHKPATLIRHTHRVPRGHTPRSQCSHLVPCLVLEYNSEQYKQDILSLSSFSVFFFFDDFSASLFPLSVEPVGCSRYINVEWSPIPIGGKICSNFAVPSLVLLSVFVIKWRHTLSHAKDKKTQYEQYYMYHSRSSITLSQSEILDTTVLVYPKFSLLSMCIWHM